MYFELIGNIVRKSYLFWVSSQKMAY